MMLARAHTHVVAAPRAQKHAAKHTQTHTCRGDTRSLGDTRLLRHKHATNNMADDGKEPKDDPFADDDDDDDEPAEGEEEGAAKKGVPMVGDVTLQDGRLFWAGLWADSEEDLKAGKGKKFKYGGPEGQSEAALTQMPSGEWHGYFFNPGDEGDTKCKEKGVKLKFDGNQARGGGENQFGEFSLKGSYDASTKKMTLRKAYLYQDDDDDDDEIVDAEPEDVAAEIAGLEGDAEIPIEELRKRMAAFEEEERKAKAAKTA